VDWDDLKHVAALAEAGSVRRAGALIGIHGATVARHVERLERQLGVKLFSRTRVGMVPTQAGSRVLEVYRELSENLHALERELQAQGAALAGPATLYVSEALATGWLVPRLGEFMVRHPEIQLTLRTAPAALPLVPGGAEAALVVTRNPPGELVGRRLGEVAICGYRARAGVLDTAGHVGAAADRMLGPLLDEFAPVWRAAGRRPQAEVPLHCPALSAQFEACRAGLGVAVLPCILADGVPGVERVDPADPLAAGEAWLLSHPESRGIARLQALLGYVQEIWTADMARIEGRTATETGIPDA
jgi:DNA-binding transcriptional LysR family regulator